MLSDATTGRSFWHLAAVVGLLLIAVMGLMFVFGALIAADSEFLVFASVITVVALVLQLSFGGWATGVASSASSAAWRGCFSSGRP